MRFAKRFKKFIKPKAVTAGRVKYSNFSVKLFKYLTVKYLTRLAIGLLF